MYNLLIKNGKIKFEIPKVHRARISIAKNTPMEPLIMGTKQPKKNVVQEKPVGTSFTKPASFLK